MAQPVKLLGLYYSAYSASRRIGVRTQESYRHERIDLRKFDTLKEMVVWLITRIAELDSAFLETLADQDDKEFMRRGHRTRRYFSQHQDTLYLQNQALAMKFSVPVGKYWLATNVGSKEVSQLIRTIAKAAGVAITSTKNATI